MIMRSVLAIVLLSVLPVQPAVASDCQERPDRLDEVHVRTWSSTAAPRFFPELDDPQLRVPWLAERPSLGIAFSGGGTRAATAALGQLRALNMMGWLSEARYLAANSGGSWSIWPYTYLRRGQDASCLGDYVPPAEIDDRILNPPKDDEGAMSNAIYRTLFLTRLGSLIYGDEAYSNAIGRMFLEPFRLHDRAQLFTFHAEAYEQVREANPCMREDDLMRIDQERPYPLILGSMRVPLDVARMGKELFVVEATPLYIGVRPEVAVEGVRNVNKKRLLVGGGYVESFGYDSYAPQTGPDSNGRWTVRLRGSVNQGSLPLRERYRFTLSDVIGMSGAAPSVKSADYNPLRLFPGFRHWAINRDRVASDDDLAPRAVELVHGDGGDTDNLALSPLLARRVENILVLVNSDHAFNHETTDCNRLTPRQLKDDLLSLFLPESQRPPERRWPKQDGWSRSERRWPKQVFSDPDHHQLSRLCEALKSDQQNGEPLVHCDRYQVLTQRRLGIDGSGYAPRICWVYLDYVDGWRDDLRDDRPGTKLYDLKEKQKDFRNFPHFSTVFERRWLIDLDRTRVHALSNLTAWVLLRSRQEIATGLAGANLPIAD